MLDLNDKVDQISQIYGDGVVDGLSKKQLGR